MRRADRLFQIVQHLRGGRLVTAAQLAERLEVSERTIYRDILDLQTNGVPIDGERGVGYIMRSGFELPPLMFTRKEIVSLVAGARFIQAWGGQSMAMAAQEALIKIEAVLPEDERGRLHQVEIRAPGYSMDIAHRERVDELEEAIEMRRRLAIDYIDGNGNETSRTVRPLGLWYWGKVLTVLAWCELREGFRLFRIDRIKPGMRPGSIFRLEKGRTLADFYAQMEDDGYPAETLKF